VTTDSLESQISRWRAYLAARRAVATQDVAELEDHLREQIDGLQRSGLDPDEAFLVAVKRMGSLDALSLQFAREHSARLWKQLVMPATDGGGDAAARADARAAGLAAIGAALAIKLPALFGIPMVDAYAGFYLHNLSLFVLPILTAYFGWKRQLDPITTRWLVAAFLGAAAVVNLYPYSPGGHTEGLAVLHLPIALWLAVGIAYAGGRWGSVAGRMDFVRFTGELFIYGVLLALGWGVLIGLTAALFGAIGVPVETLIGRWLLPCGGMAGIVVAAWLVEAKQSVIENMAPVLTRVFTPLFAVVLVVFLLALPFAEHGIPRDLLITFDLVLVVVLGLLLYAVSARDAAAPAGPFDLLQVILVVAALLVDAAALGAIVLRISEYGFSPNRTAALGLNLILLANLAWSALLYAGFLRARTPFSALERWQTAYLPVYAGWAALVVIGFPPLFAFI